MCDCYEEKCSEPSCSVTIPIHIADFCTSRDNIKVYCKKHITEKCLIFSLKEGSGGRYPKNYKVGFEVIDKEKIVEPKHFTWNPDNYYQKRNKEYRKYPYLDVVVSPNSADWEWIK